MGVDFSSRAETASVEAAAALDAVLDLVAFTAFGFAGDFPAEALLAAGFADLAGDELVVFAAAFF